MIHDQVFKIDEFKIILHIDQNDIDITLTTLVYSTVDTFQTIPRGSTPSYSTVDTSHDIAGR